MIVVLDIAKVIAVDSTISMATVALAASQMHDNADNGVCGVLRQNRPLIGRQAQIAAGTSLAERTVPAPDMPVDVSALLDQLPGLDRKRVLQKLRDLTDATKTVTATFMGKITDSLEVVDNPTQLAATRLALQMHRLVDADSGRVSVGTVNVLFAGALPDWTVQAGDGSKVVHTGDSTTNAPPPLSTIEGTGSDPRPCAHTNSASADGPSCVNTLGSNASVPVTGVPATSVPAKSKLSSRVVKKRVARLPVYRGTE